MTNKQRQISDAKWEKQSRYIDLMLKYMEIRDELFELYPDRMWEGEKKFAEKLLRRNIIKCDHE
ncbi:MAG: hypothetical protein AAB609_04335 [Patescibacteria group bacterium]